MIFGVDSNITTSPSNRGVFIMGRNPKFEQIYNYGVSIFGDCGGYDGTYHIDASGVSIFGGGATIESPSNVIIGGNVTKLKFNNRYSPYIVGNDSIIGFCANDNGVAICGTGCEIYESSDNIVIAGSATKIISNNNTLHGLKILQSVHNDYLDQVEAAGYRRGVIVVVQSSDKKYSLNDDKTFKVYWPNRLEYSAQTYGYVRYTYQMNITDPDGEYIIKDGKLTVSDEVAALKAEIAELREMVESLSK